MAENDDLAEIENSELPAPASKLNLKVVIPCIVIALLLILNVVQYQKGQAIKGTLGKVVEIAKNKEANVQKLNEELTERKLEIETTKGILAQKEKDNADLQDKLTKIQAALNSKKKKRR